MQRISAADVVDVFVCVLAFGDSVRLGSFFAVTGLILVLLLARSAVRRLLMPEASTDVLV